MTGPGSERVVVANWNARMVSITVLLLVVIAFLGGIFDPFDRSTKGELWPGAFFVAVPMMLAVRGFVVGLVVVGDKVISRGWFRTRTFGTADVAAVRAVNYSGHWNRSSSSTFFLMLELSVAGRQVEIPAVVGRPKKVQRLASQLRAAVSVKNSSGPS